MKQTFEDLVCKGLGYCCVWVFFRRFKQTATIATRLGCDPRTVRLWKAKVKNGQLTCANCPNCMKKKIPPR